MTDLRLVYVTTKDAEEAAMIGRTLVEERLVACANVIDGLRSIYRWEGALCDESEALALMKTTVSRVDQVIDRTKELHSYDCPCVVTVPIQEGNPEFLKWIEEECSDKA